MEQYKAIPGLVGYEASNLGNIRSLDRKVAMLHRTGKVMWVPRKGKVLRQYSSMHPKSKSPKGYMKVTIKKKKAYTHRLVALAWCEGYRKGLQVNHINQGTLDNRAENLEWVTPEQNQLLVKRTPKNKYLGISKRRGGWGAWKRINGKSKYLGAAATPEDAHKLYLAA